MAATAFYSLLLSLWSDKWSASSASSTATASLSISIGSSGGGGGHKHRRQYYNVWDPSKYERAHDDYWAAREVFLKRHLPIEIPEEAEERVPEVTAKVERHNRMIEIVASTPIPLARMDRISSVLDDLENKIQTIQMAMNDDEEAIEILLLM